MPDLSALGPIDPSSVISTGGQDESEQKAPWIIRKLVGSMTGRIVLSSYESMRAAGTSIICLSPWGDSSPLLLPCVRFRDLVVHTVIVATGGMAAVASPVMGPVSDLVISNLGDSIIVELGLYAGFETSTKLANDLVIGKAVKHIIPTHSQRLETTAVKVLLITLKFKQTTSDAALGFFRSSIHKDTSLVSTVKDYLAVEKGWFSPYLFASARRPIIPRTMQPDVLFCHGPFLEGDYKLGETLMNESASVILLTKALAPLDPKASPKESFMDKLHIPESFAKLKPLSRSRTPSPTPDGGKLLEPEPQLTLLPPPPTPRRMVILVCGLKPHRKLWTTSARPGESVMNYILLNGCPSIVVPVKLGAPLVAWDGLTLQKLWEIELPEEGKESQSGKFEEVVKILFEFLDLCIDWDRVKLDTDADDVDVDVDSAKDFVQQSLILLVAAAIRSKDSKQVKKEVDEDRAGIAMWRIP